MTSIAADWPAPRHARSEPLASAPAHRQAPDLWPYVFTSLAMSLAAIVDGAQGRSLHAGLATAYAIVARNDWISIIRTGRPVLDCDDGFVFWCVATFVWIGSLLLGAR